MHIDCPCLNRHGDIPCRCQQKVSRADMPGMVKQRNEQLIFCGCQVDAAALPLNRGISFIDGQIFIIFHPEYPTYHNRQSALARFPTPAERLRRQENRHNRGRRNTNPLQMFQRYIGSASDRQHEQRTENGSCCPRYAFCGQTHSITFSGYKESSSTKGSWSRFCQSASTKCRSYRS